MTTLETLASRVEASAPAIDWPPGVNVIGAYRVGHSKPNGHPADGMTATVNMGDGAFSTIPNPMSYENGGIVWTLTYGDAHAVRLTAGSLISSYDYLLSDAINMREAVQRLRLLRNARRALRAIAATRQEGR